MEAQISEQDLLVFLDRIEQGDICLTPKQQPQDIYAGNVDYAADNGWEIRIFNDANEWDYIDGVMAPDGRTIGFDQIEQMPAANAYDPSDEIAWKRYGIPGHMKFRCTECGKRLRSGPPYRAPYLCPKHKGNNEA